MAEQFYLTLIGDYLSCSPPISEENPRLVVHCSGGIGRSGTFLSVFSAFDHLWASRGKGEVDSAISGYPNMKLVEPSGAVNLKEIVWYMRRTRHPWMVEGAHQYKMAYDILIQMLKNAQ